MAGWPGVFGAEAKGKHFDAWLLYGKAAEADMRAFLWCILCPDLFSICLVDNEEALAWPEGKCSIPSSCSFEKRLRLGKVPGRIQLFLS